MQSETATLHIEGDLSEASWEDLVATALGGAEETVGWTDCWATN